VKSGVDIASEPLLVHFSIVNPSSESQTFLLWNTPFDGVWADIFDVRNKQGQSMAYIGPIARRAPPTDSDYLTLGAGESKSVQVDLARFYEFATDGPYWVNVRASSLLDGVQYSNAIEQVAEVIVTGTAIVRVQRELMNEMHNNTLGASYTNCASGDITNINTAYNQALADVRRARTCTSGSGQPTGACGSLYTRWYGVWSSGNYGVVQAFYTNVQAYFPSANYYCNPSGCSKSTYAYVYPTDSTMTIYLCGAFWSVPAERANTLVHEESHFNKCGSSQDYQYGVANCVNLAKTNPTNAAKNADNICYFSSEAP